VMTYLYLTDTPRIFENTLFSQRLLYHAAHVLLDCRGIIYVTVLGIARELGYCGRHSDQLKGWTSRGANPDRGNRFLSSPNRPDRLWGPPSLHFNGHHSTSLGKVARAWCWPRTSI